MPTSRFLLTDSGSGSSHDCFSISPEAGLALAGATEWSVEKETMRGGVSEGIDLVTINNGALTLRVLPTRGMGIWNASLRDLHAGWNSPVARPVHPAFVPLEALHGLGWLRGFNEFVVRCGLANNGSPGDDPEGNPLENPLTLHGRIANQPAHHVELEVDDEGPGTIRLTGIVDETSMFGTNLRLTSTLSTRAGSNEFVIRDRVTNRGAAPAESQMLYHINLGLPLLEAGSRLVVPAREVAPHDARAAEGIADWQHCAGPEIGFTEQVYFVDPLADEQGESFALLRNATGDKGISIHFNRTELPCLSLWKNTGAIEDGYVIGIEPATNFPNPRQFERSHGRVLKLEPGESREMTVRLILHDRLEDVALFEALAGEMIDSAPCQTHATPRECWSPV